MTIKDWFDLLGLLIGVVLTVVATLYSKDKAKINHATRAGQLIDVVGKLATYAVHEADHEDLNNEQKRDFAVELVTQALSRMGITSVTDQMIKGAIEKAVNTMHLANGVDTTDEIATDVPDSNIVSPVDQPPKPDANRELIKGEVGAENVK